MVTAFRKKTDDKKGDEGLGTEGSESNEVFEVTYKRETWSRPACRKKKGRHTFVRKQCNEKDRMDTKRPGI